MSTDYLEQGAELKGDYRYVLWRVWDRGRPSLLWVMKNPSTADAEDDDQTIQACVRYSKKWKFGGLRVVNLFALVSPYPRDLMVHPDPTGDPRNLRRILREAKNAHRVVCAWGWLPPALALRAEDVTQQLVRVASLNRLLLTAKGQPCHPDRKRRDLPLRPWRRRARI